jgi:hypothetical protein
MFIKLGVAEIVIAINIIVPILIVFDSADGLVIVDTDLRHSLHHEALEGR